MYIYIYIYIGFPNYIYMCVCVLYGVIYGRNGNDYIIWELNRAYIGIMENEMETIIMGYLGVI